jgi:hypothetical protein
MQEQRGVLLGVHLLRSQCKALSAVELKRVGFSLICSLMIVTISEELVSVSKAGPDSSIESSID